MSKVSLKLTKTLIDEHLSEDEEAIEMEKIKYTNRINKGNIMIPKFNTNTNTSVSTLLPNEIMINVVVKDQNENILLKKIVLQIEEKDKVVHIINESINYFNKLFEFERIPLRISVNDMSLFCLKPSKKNGLPNYDMPCKYFFILIEIAINNEANILDIKIKSFSLIFPNSELSFTNSKRNSAQIMTQSSGKISCELCKNCILM